MRRDRSAPPLAVPVIAVSLAALATACASELPAPSVRPLPPADEVTIAAEALTDRIASYDIEARLDTATHKITAKQVLTWKNSGTQPVNTAPLHLYLNAFKNEDSLFIRESGGQHRGSERGAWGWIELTKVAVGDQILTGSITYPGPDETVAVVKLPRTVGPGETLTLSIEFEAQLPEVFARTGYKGQFHMVGQWFPKIGVRVPDGAYGKDDERWHCEPFHPNSEFFADFGNYNVTLDVPDTHVVVATGHRVSAVDIGEGRRVHKFVANDVHDFVWMADPHMERVSGTAKTSRGDVEVRVYFRPDQRRFADRHLHAGIGAIETFSELYIAYPWPIMSIISPPPDALAAGGMEYPTVVTTAGDGFFSSPGVRLGEFVTVHEVGHNWFQGILASNEIEHAWMDEGINEYADTIVMEKLYGVYGVDALGLTIESAHRARLRVDLGELPDPIITRSHDYVDNAAYGAATYGKTGAAMRTLENIVGVERFREAMKTYAERFAFEHPTPEDLFGTLSAHLGEDISWFVEPAFYQRGVIDLRVRKIKCQRNHGSLGVFGSGEGRAEKDDKALGDGYRCSVWIVNHGQVPAPAKVEITLTSGHKLERFIDRSHHWHEIEIEASSPIAQVVIDPDGLLSLNVGATKSGLRRVPDKRASRRVGAKAQHWTQTAMQVFGL